jgi:hypothetical protein
VITLLSSILLQVRQLGLVLVDSREAFHKVRLVVLVFSALLAALLAATVLSPLGTWIVEDLHGLERSLGRVALEALFWLAPVSLLGGLYRLYSGVLVGARHTGVVSAAATASIAVSIGATFALLAAPFVRARPIRLPILVTYAGRLTELAVAWWGYRRYVRGALPARGRVLSYAYIVRFYWPLALIMAVQGASRPLINLFVSRGPNGAEALAVLTVVNSLAHLLYGWLNDLRSLPAAFQEEANSLGHIRRFALGCGLSVFAAMVLLYWTPMRPFILGTLIGVEDALVAQAAMPLVLFSFFPLAVMVRAYWHGVGLRDHRTRSLAPSGPARIAAILVALLAFSTTDVPGATRGVAALLAGFVVEAIAVWLGVRGAQKAAYE